MDVQKTPPTSLRNNASLQFLIGNPVHSVTVQPLKILLPNLILIENIIWQNAEIKNRNSVYIFC